MKKNFKITMGACFIGYIIQAIINTFTPLLFVTFNTSYGIAFSRIALLVSINFILQLTVDLICAVIINKTGWRIPIVLAQILAMTGLISLAVLPSIMDNKFAALLISVCISAIGGGLLEVLVSPIIEACPTKNKAGMMSLLHSFYCWGYCGVILISTLFFAVFGIDKWQYLTMIWAIVPFINTFLFIFSPLGTLEADTNEKIPVINLFKNKYFILMLVIMFCAASSEQAVSQWASAFTEKALNISKTTGDLLGTLMFAALMGISRLIHGFFSPKIKIPLEKTIFFSGLLCILSYLLISLSPIPAISMLGIGLCGFSVGILWPGTFSLAGANIKGGGTAMFAILALFGDLGCGTGAFAVGNIATAFNDNLNIGILITTAAPIIMCLCLFAFFKKKPKT